MFRKWQSIILSNVGRKAKRFWQDFPQRDTVAKEEVQATDTSDPEVVGKRLWQVADHIRERAQAILAEALDQEERDGIERELMGDIEFLEEVANSFLNKGLETDGICLSFPSTLPFSHSLLLSLPHPLPPSLVSPYFPFSFFHQFGNE